MAKSTKQQKSQETVTSKISSFFKEFKENVTEGAKTLASLSSEVFEDAKEKAEEWYEIGSEKFEHASGVVQSYVDRFKSEKAMKQLIREKEELTSILGDAVFHEFKKNGTVSKRFLTTKKSQELISSIEEIDKQILKLGKELEKSQKA
jgi:hypothetical protein